VPCLRRGCGRGSEPRAAATRGRGSTHLLVRRRYVTDGSVSRVLGIPVPADRLTCRRVQGHVEKWAVEVPQSRVAHEGPRRCTGRRRRGRGRGLRRSRGLRGPIGARLFCGAPRVVVIAGGKTCALQEVHDGGVGPGGTFELSPAGRTSAGGSREVTAMARRPAWFCTVGPRGRQGRGGHLGLGHLPSRLEESGPSAPFLVTSNPFCRRSDLK
jgi:hypothetical protein